MGWNKILFFGLSLLFFYACSSEKKPASSQIQKTKKATEPVEKASQGKMLYMQFCMACHMENGEGVPGLYPPLAQTEYVLGDKTWLIKNILNGQDGPIEVKGQQYNNVMAKLDYLNDQQIAEVLSFVRSNFGNNAPAVTAGEVKMVRNANKK